MTNEIKNNPLLAEIDELISPAGLRVIDFSENKLSATSSSWQVYVVKADGSGVSTDDQEKVYGPLFQFLQLKSGTKKVTLELSSAGLERKIKDVYEFNFFKGKKLRVFDANRDKWIYGVVDKTSDKSLFVTSGFVADENSLINQDFEIKFDDIKKANLLMEFKR